jgi:diguanylate cyclase (GGDEF)-like protein
MQSRARVFWPAVLFAVAMFTILSATGMTLVRNFDEDATFREETLVKNGIAQRIDEVAALVVPQVIWDDAVRNLNNRLDLKWARQNVGIYLHKSNGFYASYVLGAKDQPVFAFIRGLDRPPTSYAAISRNAAPLIRDIRSSEKRRRASVEQGALLGAPIQSSSVVLENGNVHILTATLVQPDFGSAVIRGDRAPVLVTDMAVDAVFLHRFAQRFLLTGLHLRNDSRLDRPAARAPLRNHDGRLVATIVWDPQNPGTRLLHKVGIPAFVLIVLLAGIVLILFRRGVEMTEGLVRSEARAAHFAFHDALTGLANRPNFTAILENAIRQMRTHDEPLAILCVDLDRFKEVTEAHGHAAGDAFVAEAARRLERLCRSSDVLARFEADEFCVLLRVASPEVAMALTDRLCSAMAEPMELSFGQVLAGCSIGIAIVRPDEEATATEALRHADLALNAAKRCARGHFCLFETGMDSTIQDRRSLESDLTVALSGGALDVHYQPQVNRRGVMTGVEALVRWTHPERGDVSPALFIPVAEQSGLILQIGLFALRRAFEDGSRWPNLRVAVNISAVQLRTEEFVPQLTALVDELGIDPGRFELEITESILIDDEPEIHARLRTLRDLGFQLALDDFGTGYSSLSFLRRYPVSKLKIDRSFVTHLGVDEGADAVVAAIVRLASALNLSVIAEGVETRGQRKRLAEVGCFDIQGFLYSRAVPAVAIDAICQNRASRLRPVRLAA